MAALGDLFTPRRSMWGLVAGAAIVAVSTAPQEPAAGSGSQSPVASAPATTGAGEARVELVADLNPGPASAIPIHSRLLWPPIEGSIFFAAKTPGFGPEPWVSGGTAATTRMVGDIVPGPEGVYFGGLTRTAHGTLLTFSRTLGGSSEPSYWSTTTTGAGAGDLTLLWSSPLSSTDAATFGDDALVLAADASDESYQLWRSDGTVGAPEVLYDGPAGAGGRRLRVAGDQAFFFEDPGRLMVTDGTVAGTQVVRRWTRFTWHMRALDHRVVVDVTAQGVGRELWVSDGTTAGTNLLRDIWPGEADSEPGQLTHLAGVMYFTANDGRHGREVWRTDGTPAGTMRVTNFAGRVHRLQVCDGSLFFVGVDRASAALWTSDGTAGTERRVAALPGRLGNAPENLRCTSGGFAFFAHEQHGRELWTLRTGAQRPVLHDIRPGPGTSVPYSLRRAGDTLFFIANDGEHGRELWSVTFDPAV